MSAASSSSSDRPVVLVCGGCGFIGSHTSVLLLEAGYDVFIVDNNANSSPESLNRIGKLVENNACDANGLERMTFVHVDMCNKEEFENKVFARPNAKPFVAAVHFAGLKSVGESVSKPLLYYENNLISTLNLLDLMDKYHCTALVFSSSATVYGLAPVPIVESTPTGSGITNAYGRTKYMIEEILKDFIASKKLNDSVERPSGIQPWRVTILRYFNPVGAHPSGTMGEDPSGIPNNLMPYVAQVAVGRRPELTVFGNDYDTPDGTGVRDYIHVMDLASGHVQSLKQLGCDVGSAIVTAEPVARVYNLGTGSGFSVLEMIAAMEKASGRKINYKIGPRRTGDIGVCYADPTAAQQDLDWRAVKGLDEMCQGKFQLISE